METPDDIRKVARDIMDNACLGEHWVNNGVDGELRADIARAILSERERCATIADDRAAVYRNLRHNAKALVAANIGRRIRTPSTGEET